MSQPPTPYNPNQAPRNLAQLIAGLGQQSQLVQHSIVDPRALAAGIKASFAVMTFKGKTWGLRYRGKTQQLLARDANGAILGAIPTVDVIIVKSATAISKTFYLDKYKEGDFRQPDCWSTNGIRPDPAAPKRQNETCRGCKWDAFGSRQMDDGRNAKACADSKRLAIVPADDIRNEGFGGPMLLKLPPSSFAGLSELENQLHMQGYNYFALRMRLSFDPQAAFPKLIFTPVGVLDDYQMQEVLNWQTHEIVDRILSEELVEVTADPGQADPAERPVTAQVVPFPPPQTPTQQHHAAMVQQTAFNPAPPPGTNGAAVPPAAPPVYTQQPQPAANVQPPPEAAAETAEQKIARLEAELAAASGKPTRGRRRSSPVTPNGNQPSVAVTPPAPTPPAQATPFTQQLGQPSVPPDDQSDDDGDTPPDLDDRIDKLLKP